MRNTSFALLTASGIAQTFREEVRDGFLIGSQFDVPKIENTHPYDSKYFEVFNREFNFGTAGNHCKPALTQKQRGDFDLTNCIAHMQKTIENG